MSRGAIKYQPFSALEGHKEAIKKVEEEVYDVTKPYLSEDDYERINTILIECINNNLVCTISLFKKDRILKIKSKINKVLNGYLYLDEEIILITDIINIEL